MYICTRSCLLNKPGHLLILHGILLQSYVNHMLSNKLYCKKMLLLSDGEEFCRQLSEVVVGLTFLWKELGKSDVMLSENSLLFFPVPKALKTDRIPLNWRGC